MALPTQTLKIIGVNESKNEKFFLMLLFFDRAYLFEKKSLPLCQKHYLPNIYLLRGQSEKSDCPVFIHNSNNILSIIIVIYSKCLPLQNKNTCYGSHKVSRKVKEW